MYYIYLRFMLDVQAMLDVLLIVFCFARRALHGVLAVRAWRALSGVHCVACFAQRA